MPTDTKTSESKASIPSWMEPGLKDYTSAVLALGNKNPAQYTPGASPLQQAAFARIGKMNGVGSAPISGGQPTGGSPAPSTGKGLFSSLGVTPSTNSNPVAGNVANGSTSATKKAPLPSLSAGITGDGSDPSLLNALATGRDPMDWLTAGGPSPGHHLSSSVLGFNVWDPLGFNKKSATDAYDVFGKPQDNSKNAGAYDYAAYTNSNPDVLDWANTLQTKDPRGYDLLKKSYDLDADGELSLGEYGQAHYTSFGKKEGRSILSPDESYAQQQAGATGGNTQSRTLFGEPQREPSTLDAFEQEVDQFLSNGPATAQQGLLSAAPDWNGMYGEAADMARRTGAMGPNTANPYLINNMQNYSAAQAGAPQLGAAQGVNAPSIAGLERINGPQFGTLQQAQGPNFDPLKQAQGPNFAPVSQVNAPQFGAVSSVNAPKLGDAATWDAIMASGANIGDMDQIVAGLRDGSINEYMNPELSSVVDASLADFDNEASRLRARDAASAAGQKMFGGDAYQIRKAALDGDLARGRATTSANLRSAAYDRATGLLGTDVGSRNQGKLAQAQLDQQTNLANAGFANTAAQSNAGAKNQFAMQQGLLDFDAGRFNADAQNTRSRDVAGYDFSANQANAGAQNQRASEQAGYDYNTGVFNADAANRRASEQAGYDFNAGTFNAGQANQRDSERAGYDFTANQANADAANRRASEDANYRFSADQFTAGANNARDSERAGLEQQRGLFNTGAENDARRYGADTTNQAIMANAGVLNDTSRFNAQQSDVAANRQLASAGLLSDVGARASADERAAVDQMLQAGEIERAIQTAQASGDIMLLGEIGRLLGISPGSLIGQTNTQPGTNRGMSALGGAGAGATMGTQIMPGWGTLIGAVGGGLLGAYA